MLGVSAHFGIQAAALVFCDRVRLRGSAPGTARPLAKTMLRMVRFLRLEPTHECGYRHAGGVVSTAQRALLVEHPTDGRERIGQLLDVLTQSGAAIDRELQLLAALVQSPPVAGRP